MKKRRDVRRMTVLGGFVLICLASLVVLTFTLSNLSLTEKVEWTVYFGEESLVKKGYDVVTAGTKAGTVKEVSLVPDHELEPERHVKVVLSLDKDVTLWEGAEIVVSTRGLLGRPLVQLFRGQPRGQTLDPEVPLPGRLDAGLFAALDGVVADNRSNIARFTKNLADLSQDLRAGKGTLGRLLTDEVVFENFRRVTESLAKVVEAVESPDSSIGQFLRDPAFYDSLRGAADDVRSIAADLRAGKGTAGRLLTDATLATDLEQAVSGMRRLVGRIEKGEGTLGLLLTDDRLHSDLVAGVRALRQFTERMDSGEGTFSKLLADDEVYENLRVFTRDLRTVSESLRSGKGSLGRLLTDDTLIRELEVTLRSFREGADVARENAPLSSLVSFTSLFFNVLN